MATWEFDGWRQGSNESELTQAVNNMEETAGSERGKKIFLKEQKEKKKKKGQLRFLDRFHNQSKLASWMKPLLSVQFKPF